MSAYSTRDGVNNVQAVQLFWIYVFVFTPGESDIICSSMVLLLIVIRGVAVDTLARWLPLWTNEWTNTRS